MNQLPRRTQAAGALIAIVLACALAAVQIVTAQAGDHWVGTWSTATVGRPQTAPQAGGGGGRGRGGAPPAAQNQCPPNPAPAAPGFMHFTNQTLRQIVHTSVGGSRLRVVLSNHYGNEPLAIGAAHVALRDNGRGDQVRHWPQADLQRRAVVHDSAGRGRLQRSRRSRRFRPRPTSRSISFCLATPTLRRR